MKASPGKLPPPMMTQQPPTTTLVFLLLAGGALGFDENYKPDFFHPDTAVFQSKEFRTPDTVLGRIHKKNFQHVDQHGGRTQLDYHLKFHHDVKVANLNHDFPAHQIYCGFYGEAATEADKADTQVMIMFSSSDLALQFMDKYTDTANNADQLVITGDHSLGCNKGHKHVNHDGSAMTTLISKFVYDCELHEEQAAVSCESEDASLGEIFEDAKITMNRIHPDNDKTMRDAKSRTRAEHDAKERWDAQQDIDERLEGYAASRGGESKDLVQKQRPVGQFDHPSQDPDTAYLMAMFEQEDEEEQLRSMGRRRLAAKESKDSIEGDLDFTKLMAIINKGPDSFDVKDVSEILKMAQALMNNPQIKTILELVNSGKLNKLIEILKNPIIVKIIEKSVAGVNAVADAGMGFSDLQKLWEMAKDGFQMQDIVDIMKMGEDLGFDGGGLNSENMGKLIELSQKGLSIANFKEMLDLGMQLGSGAAGLTKGKYETITRMAKKLGKTKGGEKAKKLLQVGKDLGSKALSSETMKDIMNEAKKLGFAADAGKKILDNPKFRTALAQVNKENLDKILDVAVKGEVLAGELYQIYKLGADGFDADNMQKMFDLAAKSSLGESVSAAYEKAADIFPVLQMGSKGLTADNVKNVLRLGGKIANSVGNIQQIIKLGQGGFDAEEAKKVFELGANSLDAVEQLMVVAKEFGVYGVDCEEEKDEKKKTTCEEEKKEDLAFSIGDLKKVLMLGADGFQVKDVTTIISMGVTALGSPALGNLIASGAGFAEVKDLKGFLDVTKGVLDGNDLTELLGSKVGGMDVKLMQNVMKLGVDVMTVKDLNDVTNLIKNAGGTIQELAAATGLTPKKLAKALGVKKKDYKKAKRLYKKMGVPEGVKTNLGKLAAAGNWWLNYKPTEDAADPKVIEAQKAFKETPQPWIWSHTKYEAKWKGVKDTNGKTAIVGADKNKVETWAKTLNKTPAGGDIPAGKDVGHWGGTCTCPDGREYGAGDNADNCHTIACYGGVSGTCNKHYDAKWAGNRVTCFIDDTPPSTVDGDVCKAKGESGCNEYCCNGECNTVGNKVQVTWQAGTWDDRASGGYNEGGLSIDDVKVGLVKSKSRAELLGIKKGWEMTLINGSQVNGHHDLMGKINEANGTGKAWTMGFEWRFGSGKRGKCADASAPQEFPEYEKVDWKDPKCRSYLPQRGTWHDCITHCQWKNNSHSGYWCMTAERSWTSDRLWGWCAGNCKMPMDNSFGLTGGNFIKKGFLKVVDRPMVSQLANNAIPSAKILNPKPFLLGYRNFEFGVGVGYDMSMHIDLINWKGAPTLQKSIMQFEAQAYMQGEVYAEISDDAYTVDIPIFPMGAMTVTASKDLFEDDVEGTGAGNWGGACTCPNGKVYQVGDSHDSCGSLMCDGGISGKCHKKDDGPWKGKSVKCGQKIYGKEIRNYADPDQPDATKPVYPIPSMSFGFAGVVFGLGWRTQTGMRFEIDTVNLSANAWAKIDISGSYPIGFHYDGARARYGDDYGPGGLTWLNKGPTFSKKMLMGYEFVSMDQLNLKASLLATIALQLAVGPITLCEIAGTIGPYAMARFSMDRSGSTCPSTDIAMQQFYGVEWGLSGWLELKFALTGAWKDKFGDHTFNILPKMSKHFGGIIPFVTGEPRGVLSFQEKTCDAKKMIPNEGLDCWASDWGKGECSRHCDWNGTLGASCDVCQQYQRGKGDGVEECVWYRGGCWQKSCYWDEGKCNEIPSAEISTCEGDNMGSTFGLGDLERCGTDLASLSSPYQGSTATKTNKIRLECGQDDTAPEQIFRYDLIPGAKISIGMTTNNFDSKHQLSYGAPDMKCPGNKVVKCTDDPDTETLEWLNDTERTQTAFYTVDGSGSAKGSFTIQWTITMPPPKIPQTKHKEGQCLKTWTMTKGSVVSSCNAYCCNPDGDAEGLWCKTEPGSEVPWSYCDVSQDADYFKTTNYKGSAAVVPSAGKMNAGGETASEGDAKKVPESSAAGMSALFAFAISLGIAML